MFHFEVAPSIPFCTCRFILLNLKYVIFLFCYISVLSEPFNSETFHFIFFVPKILFSYRYNLEYCIICTNIRRKSNETLLLDRHNIDVQKFIFKFRNLQQQYAQKY